MPGDLVGKPDSIVRDALGKIIYQDYPEGETPTQSESFVCDECGKPFVVEPVISYKVKKEDEALDFSDPYSSLID